MEILATLPAHYDERLVVLSVGIAIFASYAALDLVGRVHATRGKKQFAWLLGGACAMGTGIWSMHYTGMVAYTLPIQVYYHVPTVIVSLLAAVVASWIALFVGSRPHRARFYVPLGGVLMGLGIATMHYTGMAAMRLAAMHHYNRLLWTLSVLLAVLVSLCALWLSARFRDENQTWRIKLPISIVMGLAIPTMHYTGMAAVTFMPSGPPDLSYSVQISWLADTVIVLLTFVALLFVFLKSLIDRRASVQDRLLALSEQRYQKLFESSREALVVFDFQTLLPLAANQAALKNHELPTGQFHATPVTGLYPDIARLLEPANPGLAVKTKIFHSDGSSLDVELRVDVVQWDGLPAGLLIATDISERERAKRERDMLEVQLRHAQKVEAIGQLAAGIAHEINTPMQYIGDNTRFLSDAFRDLASLLTQSPSLQSPATADVVSPPADASAPDAAYLLTEIPKAIQQTLEGIQRVTAIVMAMKEFSHPGAKDKVKTDLNHAIQSTITVSRNEWKYVSNVETDLDPSLPPVLCLPGELNQAILNLIVNSAHAIRDALGDGSPDKGTITIRTRNCGDFAEIQIHDTGTGIPENIRGRVFDPFSQPRRSAKEPVRASPSPVPSSPTSTPEPSTSKPKWGRALLSSSAFPTTAKLSPQRRAHETRSICR